MRSIGALRERVQIQTYTEVEDESHGTIKTWTTIATVYAEILPVSGLVTLDTQQIDKKITHKIIIRFYGGLTSEQWLLHQGRRFRIRNVTKDGNKRRFMILLCEEVFLTQDPFEVGMDTAGEPLTETYPYEDT